MATYKKKQGASIWVDIQLPESELAAIDPSVGAWTNNWTGAWKLTNSAGVVVLSGNMTKSATVGLFLVRIGKIAFPDLATLPIGSYNLTYQYLNTTVDYDNEETDKVTIQAQLYV